MLFNQQQCFIYSTASFLSKLRAKKVEKLHNSSFYRKFRKGNTGIGFRNDYFGFADLKKKINPDRPTIDFFDKNVMARTRKCYLKNNYLTLKSKVTLPYGHAPTYKISLTYLERQKCYGPDKNILL